MTVTDDRPQTPEEPANWGATPAATPEGRSAELLADDYGRTGEPGERATEGHPYVHPVRFIAFLGVFVGLWAWRGATIVVVILAILVMIFFHELGHFLAARRADMKVTEFFIGFGPRIFSFRRGEVEYGFKAIPAGAYVKIAGMANIEEVPPGDEARSYRSKSYSERMLVAVAGSAMHFLMALVLIFVGFAFVGDAYVGAGSDEAWEVARVSPGSAAEALGLEPGDEIVSIDGREVTTFEEFAVAARERPEETVEVVFRRDGDERAVEATMSARMDIYGTVAEDLSLIRTDGGVSVVAVAPGGVLDDAGVLAGDAITSVNGVDVETFDDVAAGVEDAEAGVLDLGIERDGSAVSAEVDLGSDLAVADPVGFFGVGPEYLANTRGLAESVPDTFAQFWSLSTQTVEGLAQVFSPSSLVDLATRVVETNPGSVDESSSATSRADANAASIEEDSGRVVSIVGAVRVGESLAETDWGGLLLLMINLNVVVGLFNLFPLPPFDGGHVSVATYEKVQEMRRGGGKRYLVDFERLLPVAYGVVVALMVISLMAMYLDIADPIPV